MESQAEKSLLYTIEQLTSQNRLQTGMLVLNFISHLFMMTRLYFCVAAGNSGGCLSILGQTQDV